MSQRVCSRTKSAVFYSISIPHYCDNPFNTAFPSPLEPAVPPTNLPDAADRPSQLQPLHQSMYVTASTLRYESATSCFSQGEMFGTSLKADPTTIPFQD
jgi:hypothetical protein